MKGKETDPLFPPRKGNSETRRDKTSSNLERHISRPATYKIRLNSAILHAKAHENLRAGKILNSNPFEKDKPLRFDIDPANSSSAFFLTFFFSFGGGIIAIPYIFSSFGWTFTIILFLVSLFLLLISSHMNRSIKITSELDQEVDSWDDTISHVFGVRGKIINAALTFLHLLTSSIAYTTILYQSMLLVFSLEDSETKIGELKANHFVLIWIGVFICGMSFCPPSGISILHKFGVLCTFGYLVLLFIIPYTQNYPIPGCDDNIKNIFDHNKLASAFISSFFFVGSALPLFPTLKSNLKRSSSFGYYSFMGIVANFFLSIYVGINSYYFFQNCVTKNVTDSLIRADLHLNNLNLGRAGSLLIAFSVFPMISILIRPQIMLLMSIFKKIKSTQRAIITPNTSSPSNPSYFSRGFSLLFIILTILFCVLAIDDISKWIIIDGSMFSISCFVFPIVLFLKLKWSNSSLFYKFCWILIILIIFTGIGFSIQSTFF